MTLQASTAKKPNPKVDKAPRKSGETNLAWLARHWGDDAEHTRLLLFGGTGPTDFRLRAAQAVVRHDFTPSHWSHVALAGPALRKTRLLEISLAPHGGFGHPPASNALQSGELARYSDVGQFPNIGVFTLSVPWADVQTAAMRLEKQRSAIDLVELTVAWLGHAWGVGTLVNPLQQQHGVPSAAAAEAILNSCGFDLAPGLTSRAASPEAIWQGCRWWHHYPGRETRREVSGAFFVTHVLGQGPRP